MKTILQSIESRKQHLARHPFFAERAGAQSLHELLSFAPRLACWVGAFQEVLRVNAQRTSEPELASLVQRHAREEGGHDTWYFDDMELLTGQRPSAALTDAAAYEPTRAATLRLRNEAFGTQSDAQRLVFLVALEATSEAFFSTLMPLVLAHGGAQQLRYFGAHHLESEHAHSLFEQTVMGRLKAMELSEHERAQAMGLVDRVFTAFDDLFEGLRAPALTAPGRRTASG